MILEHWSDYSNFFGNERVKAIFSHSSFDNEIGEIHQKFPRLLGLDPLKLIIPKQTHSTNISIIGLPGFVNNLDGIFSSNSDLVCSIQVADCLPIYFVHNYKSFAGLIHAGWKGLANGIIQNIKSLLDQTNWDSSEFNILVGPSIHPCCFEIKDDVLEHFDLQFCRKKKSGRYAVDLQEWAVKQLIEIGALKENITIIKECTFCQDKKFHSYRRDGENSGRMLALIGWI